MKTNQSRLQEVNRHKIQIELLNVRVSAPFTEHNGGESQTRGWLNLPKMRSLLIRK